MNKFISGCVSHILLPNIQILGEISYFKNRMNNLFGESPYLVHQCWDHPIKGTSLALGHVNSTENLIMN